MQNQKDNQLSQRVARGKVLYMKAREQIFVVLYEPAEEGGFVVSVPTLPGCNSQGDTFEEAQKNIIEAIELYLEASDHTENTRLPIVGTVAVHA